MRITKVLKSLLSLLPHDTTEVSLGLFNPPNWLADSEHDWAETGEIRNRCDGRVVAETCGHHTLRTRISNQARKQFLSRAIGYPLHPDLEALLRLFRVP